MKVSPGDSTHYSPSLALNKMEVYISNNINFNDPLITSGYYTNSAYVISDTGARQRGAPGYLHIWVGFPLELK